MKIILFANTDWYLYNFRLPLALRLVAEGHQVVLVSPPGPYGAELLTAGLDWRPAPMDRRSLNPLREARLLVWLWRLIRAERADVVHGFTIKCAVYGALAAKLAGASAISAVTGLGYVFINPALKARLLRPVVRGLMRFALGGDRARVIVQNRDDRRFFSDAGIVANDQIRLIEGSGVDCARFALPSPATRADRPIRILLVGRMLWDKGVGELAAAARLLKAQGRDLEFVLAGDGDSGNPASVPVAQLRQWQDEGLLTWLGHVDDGMPALLHSADIVVLPSYREGLPKTLIEAAACGKPLITTDVPGCREVVRDDVDGLLIPVRDAPALARAIARLLDDPVLAARLGQAARHKALARFDERIILSKTVSVYHELCDAADETASDVEARAA